MCWSHKHQVAINTNKSLVTNSAPTIDREHTVGKYASDRIYRVTEYTSPAYASDSGLVQANANTQLLEDGPEVHLETSNQITIYCVLPP